MAAEIEATAETEADAIKDEVNEHRVQPGTMQQIVVNRMAAKARTRAPRARVRRRAATTAIKAKVKVNVRRALARRATRDGDAARAHG